MSIYWKILFLLYACFRGWTLEVYTHATTIKKDQPSYAKIAKKWKTILNNLDISCKQVVSGYRNKGRNIICITNWHICCQLSNPWKCIKQSNHLRRHINKKPKGILKYQEHSSSFQCQQIVIKTVKSRNCFV